MIQEAPTTTAPLADVQAPGEPTRYILPPRGGRRPPLPTALRIALRVLLAVCLWVVVDFAYVVVGAEQDHAAPADAIIVLGCMPWADTGVPSDCLSARANHAADLYHKGLALHIIASGGGTDMGPPEAPALEQVLLSDGVPRYDIFKEDQSHNTIQNLQFSEQLMAEHGWKTAILVTEPYHIRRATLIAHDTGLDVYPSPAVDSPLWQDGEKRMLLIARDTLSLVLYQLKVVTGARD